MSSVFISYAREDRAAVHEIYRALTDKGISVWMDEENLKPGQDRRLEIFNAIHTCDIFVACLSGNTTRPGFVQKEFRWALEVLDQMPEGKAFIIPVRLTECEVPFEKLSELQMLDYFRPGGKKKLIKTILTYTKPECAVGDHSPAPAPIQEPKQEPESELPGKIKGREPVSKPRSKKGRKKIPLQGMFWLGVIVVAALAFILVLTGLILGVPAAILATPTPITPTLQPTIPPSQTPAPATATHAPTTTPVTPVITPSLTLPPATATDAPTAVPFTPGISPTAPLTEKTLADGCLFSGHWTPVSTDSAAFLNTNLGSDGCYFLGSLGLSVDQTGTLNVYEAARKNAIASGIYTPVTETSVIQFKLHINYLYIGASEPACLNFAIAPASDPLKSKETARFKLYVDRKDPTPLIYFMLADVGENTGSKIESQHYEYGRTYTIRLQLSGGSMRVYINNVMMNERPFIPAGPKVFVIGYNLPVQAGVDAEITEVRVDGVLK